MSDAEVTPTPVPELPKAKAKRTNAKRRLNAKQHQEYEGDLVDTHRRMESMILDLKVRHNKSLSEIGGRLFAGSKGAKFVRRLQSPRKSRIWQALVHVKGKEWNAGRSSGNRLRLKAIHARIKAEFPNWRLASRTEKEGWLDALAQYNSERETQPRSNKKGLQMDYTFTVNGIAKDMQGLEVRTGAKSFFMAARASPDLIVKPVVNCSADVTEFFWVVLGRSPERVAQMFEQFTIGGLAAVLGGRSIALEEVRSDSRRLIQAGLDIILSTNAELNEISVKSVKMNYAAYEVEIVRKHGVKLVGWPGNSNVVQPGSITNRKDLRELREALLKKTCHWVRLTEEEQAEVQHIPAPPKPRRSDFGSKRQSYKKRKVAASSDNDEGAQSDGSAN